MKLKTNKTLTKRERKKITMYFFIWQIVIQWLNWKQIIFFIKMIKPKIKNQKNKDLN
jgi:hypothetical protein